MTRVAIVSTVVPKPVDNGKRVVLSGMLRYFSDRVGAENVHYVVLGHPSSQDLGVPTHYVAPPQHRRRLANLATRTLARGTSLQESMVFGPRSGAELKRVLDDLAVDLEVFDTLRLSQYLPMLSEHSNRVVYLEDLFSRRYTEMARTNRTFPGAVVNPLGEFGGNVPAVAGRLLARPRVLDSVLRAEARLIARREDAAARQWPCLLLNANETSTLNTRAALHTRAASSRVQTMAPLLDPPAPRPRQLPQTPTFVFLGLLSLPHNDFAIRTFLAEQWDAVRQAVPGARLRIVGRAPSTGLTALVERHSESVTLEGYVDDLGETLAGATAMVSPLRFGTGIKLKLIEALARGLPVVSTGYGTEGIIDGPGQGALTSDDLSQFPALLAELCEPTRNGEVGGQALQRYRSTFAPEVVTARYDEVFGLGAHARAGGA